MCAAATLLLERSLLIESLMSQDRNEAAERSFPEGRATEEQTEKIDAIVGDEALGYDGSARGEHSGEASEPMEESLSDTLAKNRPDQVK